MTQTLHTSVMLKDVLSALSPIDGETYVDATFGAGGYSKAVLSAADCAIFGFDRDPTAVERAHETLDRFGERLTIISRPFAELEDGLAAHGVNAVDGVVFDLGVSSMQLDEPARGFSFMRDGPLSMRMDCGTPDASDLVNDATPALLAAIFKAYGEERRAKRIANAIADARKAGPIQSTMTLSEIVERAAPPPPGPQRIHPATRVFQALRIFVNDEIGQMIEGLRAAERLLRAGGRLVVVTFHSLEDRVVKRFFAARSGGAKGGSRHAPHTDGPAPSFDLINNRAIAASKDEIDNNPRARSAKLRGALRLASPAIAIGDEFFGVPTAGELQRSIMKMRG